MPREEVKGVSPTKIASKAKTDKAFKEKAQALKRSLVKDGSRGAAKKKSTKKEKAKRALKAKEGQNAANDEARRGAAAAVTKHVVTKGDIIETKTKTVTQERRTKTKNKQPKSLVVATGQVIVVPDQPPVQVRACSDFKETDAVAIGRAFNFDPHGEELKYIYLNEGIAFSQRMHDAFSPIAKLFVDLPPEDFYKTTGSYVVLSNKNLHIQSLGKKKKIPLQSMVHVDLLPGKRKGHETSVRFTYLVDDLKEHKSPPKTSRESKKKIDEKDQPKSPQGDKQKQEKVTIHFYKNIAASFIVAKIMSYLEKPENFMIRQLNVKHVLEYRKGAPERKANDLTDVSGKGYLEILAKGDKWKKQYFTLAGEWLYYFPNDKAEKQSGFIDLVPNECVIQREKSSPIFTISTLSPSETGRAAPSLRTYSIRAISEKKGDEERASDHWVATLLQHTKQLKKRTNLGVLATGSGFVNDDHQREKLTKYILEFVKGDKETGPLSSVCKEWKGYFNGREIRRQFAHTPKLVIDIGCSVWRAGFANMAKKRPDLLLPIAPYPDDDFRQVHKQRLESTFRTLFQELDVSPENCYVLIIKPLRAHRDWEKTMKNILFDTFHFRAVSIVGAGNAVGEICDLGDIKSFLLVDVGSRGTRTIPVISGLPLDVRSHEFPHLSQDAPTNEILSWICPRSTSLKLNPSQATELARLIKEQYVTCDEKNKRDYDEWCKTYKDRPMTKVEEIADAVECHIGGRTFKIPRYVLMRAGEVLFRPKELLGDEDDSLLSIQEAIWKTAEESERVNVAALISNMVVTGGGSKMQGFTARLTKEVDLLIAKLRQGQPKAEEEEEEEEEDEEKLAAKEIEEDIKSRRPVEEKLKVQPYVQEFSIPDASDFIWFGASYSADNKKAHDDKFWIANPAHPELDLEEDEDPDDEVEDEEEEAETAEEE